MTVPAHGPATLKKYNDIQEMVADLAPYLGGDNRGVTYRPQEIINASDVTLTNATITAATSPFAAANDALTVEAASLYEWELFYFLTHGATSHTTSIGLTLATATLASILGFSKAISAAADTLATPQEKPIIQAAATVVTAASTAVQTLIQAKGHLRTTLGGTISPFLLMSADPTGTILSKSGNFFRLTKLGASTDVEVGANAA